MESSTVDSSGCIDVEHLLSWSILAALHRHAAPLLPAPGEQAKTLLACVAGEITTKTYVNVPEIVRATIERIGYNDAGMGFDCKTCAVISTIAPGAS